MLRRPFHSLWREIRTPARVNENETPTSGI
jgi:hypothetical protein